MSKAFKIPKPYKGNNPFIFVSYSHNDLDTVLDVISAFNLRGYRVWYDNCVAVGDAFVKELASKIADCGVFFCFLSPCYVNAEFCKRELDYAIKRCKTIFPIMIEDFELPPEIEFQIRAIHWIRLSDFASAEEMVDYLCEVGGKALSRCSIEAPAEAPPHQMESNSAGEKSHSGDGSSQFSDREGERQTIKSSSEPERKPGFFSRLAGKLKK